MSDEEKENFMREFVKKNESDLKKFGWLRRYDDSKTFLLERPHLASEETANYLVIQCINLAMEEVSMPLIPTFIPAATAVQFSSNLRKQLPSLEVPSCRTWYSSKCLLTIGGKLEVNRGKLQLKQIVRMNTS